MIQTAVSGLQNTFLVALPAAARNATSFSAPLANPYARGILLVLYVTSNPGGGETLTLSLRTRIGAFNTTIVSTAAENFGGIGGRQYLLVYPGATVAPVSGTGNVVASSVVPSSFEIAVAHSAAGLWTYAVDCQLIL